MNGTNKASMLHSSEQNDCTVEPSTIAYRNTPLHPKLTLETGTIPAAKKHNIPSSLLDKGDKLKDHPKKSDVRSFWQAREASSYDESSYFSTGSSSPVKKSTPMDILAGKSPVTNSIFTSLGTNGQTLPTKPPFQQQHRRHQSVTRIPMPVPQPKNTSPRTSLTPEKKLGPSGTEITLPEQTITPKPSVICSLQDPTSPGAESDSSQATPHRKRKTVKFDEAAPQVLHFERENTQSPYSACSLDFAGMYGSEDETEVNASVYESPCLVEDWVYARPTGEKHGGLPDPFQCPSRTGRPLPQVPDSASPRAARSLPSLSGSSPTSKEALVEKLRELRRKASEMDVAAKKKFTYPERSNMPGPAAKVVSYPEDQAKKKTTTDDLGISIDDENTCSDNGPSPVIPHTQAVPLFATATCSENDTYSCNMACSPTNGDVQQVTQSSYDHNDDETNSKKDSPEQKASEPESDNTSPNVAVITPEVAENVNDEFIADASRPQMPEYIISPLMLPELGQFGSSDLGLSGFMSSSKDSDVRNEPTSIVSRPSTPETHMKTRFNDSNEEMLSECSPGISPERATVKGRGLKIRPSLTPADAATIAAQRRKVSGESPLPPQDHCDQSEDTAISADCSIASQEDNSTMVPKATVELPLLEVKLPRPSDTGFSDIGQAFERVIEGQKRGYLMRQNTNIVHASSDGNLGHYRHESANVESLSSSPEKKSLKVTELDVLTSSKNRPQSENSHTEKRNSTPNKTCLGDKSGNVPIKKGNDHFADCGRLFIRVLKVKDLELKLPQDRDLYFSCTLDNGVHCIQTAYNRLERTSEICQEFELLALDDLEFMLTLQVKVDKQLLLPMSPSKTKQSAFSRVFSSPKKSKKLQEQHDATSVQQHALHGVIGNDGSFARVYISLDTYKDSAFGRPYSTEVTLMNEWATDVEIQYGCKPKMPLKTTRRRPYKIGKLDIQMLYMPPAPRRASPPRSMAACIKEMQTTEWYSKLLCEGHLSQQGGDCSTWRRRYFKLIGPKLYAFHETSRNLRAAISLTKATGLYDDKNRLAQAEGSRRTSAFAEQEEGYMYVEEGFRIRFFDGEVIDFYAESEEDKERWMKALIQLISHGKIPEKAAWAEIVLQREARLLNNSRGPRLLKGDR